MPPSSHFAPEPTPPEMRPQVIPLSQSPEVAQQERLAELASQSVEAVSSIIFGQERVINESLVTLFSGGHMLLVGVPGLAKTRLVQTLGHVLGLETQRIQFTPDLLPSDILGSEVLETSAEGQRHFRFIPGPIFTQLLMADEVNRASPRTQSALLQAMQEREVSIAGETRSLPTPFHVLATQNPVEQEGTYPLPEAQLDRFMMHIDMSYPSLDAERKMLAATTGHTLPTVDPVMTTQDLLDIQNLVRCLPTGETIVDAILNLVRNTRPETTSLDLVRRSVAWGPGPRASQAFMLATRARALLDGRLAPSITDVIALAQPILRHRIALTFAARAEGITLDSLIENACRGLESSPEAA